MVAVRSTSAPGGFSSFPFVSPSTFRPRVSRMATADDSTPAATPSPVWTSFWVSFLSVTSLVSSVVSDVSLVSVSSLTSVSPAPSAPACTSRWYSGPPLQWVPARLYFYSRDRGKSSSRFFFSSFSLQFPWSWFLSCQFLLWFCPSQDSTLSSRISRLQARQRERLLAEDAISQVGFLLLMVFVLS